MIIALGNVPASSTLYVPFNTFDATGASVTITGFTLPDIAIYKNGSTTQRASTAGYVLLDTDGIDFDGVTGVHGFSIDLSDNTDAGFYALGASYWIVVGPITVNAVTVNFVAAVFRIVAAEAVAGYPTGDNAYWKGGLIPAVAVTGVPKVDATYWTGEVIPATSVTGTPKVDVADWKGGVVPAVGTTGVPKVDIARVNNTAVTGTGAPGTEWGP